MYLVQVSLGQPHHPNLMIIPRLLATPVLLCIGLCFRTVNCFSSATQHGFLPNRREAIIKGSFIAFLPSSTSPKLAYAYQPDPDQLRESLYLLSRVQEATLQQERFVRRSSKQQDLKNKMKLTLRLIEKNYKLVDQITYCSNFIPSENLVEATEAGNAAAEELQSAIDYVNFELKVGPMDDEKKDYLTSALQNTREKIFIFVDFMPKEKLEGARDRIEEENKLNIEEFDGEEDAGVYNPVKLPWKM